MREGKVEKENMMELINEKIPKYDLRETVTKTN